ncbi:MULTISPECIES: bifunctional folylpolyglutamate synthase/dihydrofolate synthase [Pontibacillus]|uniref:tetrahydrofolate synthase n=1 Tax=Pontibacillus chungwhensis TaxID=265426 RepID=A0ABY8UVS2_9BACI|nr:MULTISPECIES: folylpolyglutamate synthase/dihydrofolate synthase family protein [Pontibacillus]MCD5323742.1 bifunctional folylpolyglutamate synthase/dihydrofolate synthase [Pontibacillus sp. HN14]WIF97107.1 folylpolyglutamate synthase/dihydrofolate synthase family protein [Pontibacillus chungwhensis]
MFTTMKQIEKFFNDRKGLGIKPGFNRMYKMLEALNNPHKDIKAVHIAGTNGKGSTLAFMKQALMDQGFRVSSFVSPSFKTIREHIFLQNEPISETRFIHYINSLYPVVKEMDEHEDGPSEFELLVMVAILFSRDYATISLFEAGMGGKGDSTNVLEPILSIITMIDLDHTAFLGDTIEAITSEKAGIIKVETPVVSGVTQEEAKQIVKDTAAKKNAPLYQWGEVFTIKEIGEAYSFISEWDEIDEVRVALPGKHQQKNSSLALMGLSLMEGVHIDQAVRSFRDVEYEGRFETVSSNPTIIIDGAHNVTGAESLIYTVRKLYPDKKRTLLYSALRDKPLAEMIPLLEEAFDRVVFTTFDHARSSSPEYLASFSTSSNPEIASDWKAYINNRWDPSKEEVLVIAGSLYWIPWVKEFIQKISE